MSDTPRMESVAGHARGIVDAGILAEGMKLERELHAANERIKRLEDIIDRAANRFFDDGSDRQTAVEMLMILEEVRKAKP
jgi:hypothetical protein